MKTITFSKAFGLPDNSFADFLKKQAKKEVAEQAKIDARIRKTLARKKKG